MVNDGKDDGNIMMVMMRMGLTDNGEQDGEEERGEADPLARAAGGVNVVLQREHDGHQPGHDAK